MKQYITFDNGNKLWYNPEQAKAWSKHLDNLNNKLYFTGYGLDEEYVQKREHRDKIALPMSRWRTAIITVGNTQKMAWIDPLTGHAYKCGSYYKKTYIKYKEYKFVRFATSFDF